jgi:hypothetical protein
MRVSINQLRQTLVLVAVAAGSLACDPFGLAGLDDDELAENRALWVSLSITSYEYEVARSCFCPPSLLGPVRVRVEDGVVTERTFVDSANAGSEEPGEWFPSVEGLFDLLADAYEREAHRVEVNYDRDTGVPLAIYIDYEEFVADEEIGFSVESLPVPVS